MSKNNPTMSTFTVLAANKFVVLAELNKRFCKFIRQRGTGINQFALSWSFKEDEYEDGETRTYQGIVPSCPLITEEIAEVNSFLLGLQAGLKYGPKKNKCIACGKLIFEGEDVIWTTGAELDPKNPHIELGDLDPEWGERDYPIHQHCYNSGTRTW
jgi:hypothetical protein